MQAFVVTADKQYLDGMLAGLELENGYRVTHPTAAAAYRDAANLQKIMRERDFIRATGTGDKYQIIGNIRVSEAA